jgi:EAL domain-containing protein (putative c-di-GMP-specific phosphodiesterase class I)
MSNRQLGDRVALEAGFERALGSLWMAYQPIVSCARREVWAFEALLRSREPTLPTQGALLDAAERLGRLPELGRAIRAQVAAAVDAAPAQAVFLNLHPRDLLDETLYSATAPLSQVARKVVLEVSERASLDAIVDLRTRAEALRALGFRLAIDDFGSGYAGLATYAKLEPELVKLDLALVRDLPDSPARQGFIRSLTELTREMGVAAIAVGVETLEEREALIASGCDLLQGFLFARPDKAFPTVSPVKFSGANLRISKRLGISRIAVRLLDVDRLRTHPLRDISEKGGLIVTNAALRLGTDTRLELCGEGPPLALKAHVVREVAEEGKRLGFGVRFVFTTADVEQKVKEIVARYGERQPAEERDATVKR